MLRATTRCRHCGRPIAFGLIITSKRRIPLDPGTHDVTDRDANVAVTSDHLGSIFARVLSATDPIRPGERRAMPHFASCPARASGRGHQARRTPHTAP